MDLCGFCLYGRCHITLRRVEEVKRLLMAEHEKYGCVSRGTLLTGIGRPLSWRLREAGSLVQAGVGLAGDNFRRNGRLIAAQSPLRGQWIADSLSSIMPIGTQGAKWVRPTKTSSCAIHLANGQPLEEFQCL